MTVYVIIAFCVLLLIAYLFDISARYTRVPAVILLLFLGWLLKQSLNLSQIMIPDLSGLLPGLGSVGLILIVLEGSLELELDKSRFRTVKNTFLMSVLPMILLASLIAILFSHVSDYSFSDALLNSVPLAVISSAIAIPSVKNLNRASREFIIYESSFSDISGVLLFNFLVANRVITFFSFLDFIWQLLIIILIALAATFILSFLLNRIRHHIKYMPIILLLILVYEVSKVFHLPGLLFILIFGVFLGNIKGLKRFSIIQILKPERLDTEVHRFREIVVEAAFLIRSLFFILFGFLISTSELLNSDTFLLALIIFLSIVLFRLLFLLFFRLPVTPLIFIAPRGLITILLFLSIPAGRYIPLINNSLVIQVILLTALFMMIGLLFQKKPKENQ